MTFAHHYYTQRQVFISVMSVVALIVAAGRGTRVLADYDVPKQYLSLGGKTILRRSVERFVSHPEVDKVLVVIHSADIELYNDAVAGLNLLEPVIGGTTRQESVRRGLEALLPLAPQKILIHDAARPFVDRKIISAVIHELDTSRAVVPSVPIEDTIKKCEDSRVLWTVDRTDLWRAQTPQGFIYQDILNNHRVYKHINFTDDCAITEHANTPVTIVLGSQNNFKITTDLDYERAESVVAIGAKSVDVVHRVGIGYDIHRFSDQKADNGVISIGCTPIPHEFKIEAHSDGDVVAHAIVDAILGALSEGDIGSHFPPTDQAWQDVSSSVFLNKVKLLLQMRGAKIVNIDVTVTTEMPKISPYRNIIRQNIAYQLGIDPKYVSIKGKTKEGLDAIGSGHAIEAHAVCLIKVKEIIE